MMCYSTNSQPTKTLVIRKFWPRSKNFLEFSFLFFGKKNGKVVNQICLHQWWIQWKHQMIRMINTFLNGDAVLKSTFQKSKFQNDIILAMYTTQHPIFWKNCKSFRISWGLFQKIKNNFNFNKKVPFLYMFLSQLLQKISRWVGVSRVRVCNHWLVLFTYLNNIS